MNRNKVYQRYLVVSLDYEIFGNGLGDVLQHIVDPTERMARICEKYDSPLTVFFEAEEYLAFEKYREALNADLGYDPARAIRKQCANFANRGHDLQLHLHPEWFGATYKDGNWQLKPCCRTVDSLFDSTEKTINYIGERKAVIEEIIEEAGGSQKVTAYRAGAFSAQPGKRLIQALIDNDFVLDSSVVHGYYEKGAHIDLDYKNAPKGRRHWKVSEDVSVEDEKGRLIELPIFSRMGIRIQQVTPRRLLAKFSNHIPKAQQQKMRNSLGVSKNPLAVARFLLSRFPIKLDFHNMSARQMLRWIRKIPDPLNGEHDIIMLIGHSKEHRDDKEFEAFIKAVSQDPTLEIISLSEASRMLSHSLVAT